MRWQRLVIPAVLAVLLAASSQAYAQGKGKGKGGFSILNFIIPQLNLNDEQMEKAKKIQDEYAGKMQKIFKQMQDLNEKQLDALNEILNDDQRAQLKEIREKFKAFKGGKKAPPPE
jgi:hypothetical protein